MSFLITYFRVIVVEKEIIAQTDGKLLPLLKFIAKTMLLCHFFGTTEPISNTLNSLFKPGLEGMTEVHYPLLHTKGLNKTEPVFFFLLLLLLLLFFFFFFFECCFFPKEPTYLLQ